MKPNITDKLFLISIKTCQLKNYWKELTPNITFQSNNIFVRNYLFEKIIKSCKETNLEFLKLKEKLGLCIYKDICDEKKFILMSEKSFIQHDVENEKIWTENDNDNENENENENENKNENEHFKKKKIVKEELKEIKNLNWIKVSLNEF